MILYQAQRKAHKAKYKPISPMNTEAKILNKIVQNQIQQHMKMILPHDQLDFNRFFKINLFIFIYLFWLCWVFVAAHGLSLIVASRGYSCCRAQALGAWASVVGVCGLSSCGSRAVEHRLSSCGSWA